MREDTSHFTNKELLDIDLRNEHCVNPTHFTLFMSYTLSTLLFPTKINPFYFYLRGLSNSVTMLIRVGCKPIVQLKKELDNQGSDEEKNLSLHLDFVKAAVEQRQALIQRVDEGKIEARVEAQGLHEASTGTEPLTPPMLLTVLDDSHTPSVPSTCEAGLHDRVITYASTFRLNCSVNILLIDLCSSTGTGRLASSRGSKSNAVVSYAFFLPFKEFTQFYATT
ncbi:hypothetical protein CRG98_005117 [Punica granatum]|uniref:Uncharacterized protein n=1 Tax=Punica granatum TaxID=22663 RepID=A0A2I0L1A9_PUNGR|nr:hypothetical protein CRG98_005117 [Punica granatum]